MNLRQSDLPNSQRAVQSFELIFSDLRSYTDLEVLPDNIL